MAKKISGYIKLVVAAGSANPSPPVGPALGQKGVNIMEFCKSFNDATKDYEKGTPLPVIITVYVDKSFTFIVKLPPASFLLKKAAKLKKGSGEAGKKSVATLKVSQLESIAETKIKDMNANSIEAAVKILAGTARSMGIEIEDNK